MTRPITDRVRQLVLKLSQDLGLTPGEIEKEQRLMDRVSCQEGFDENGNIIITPEMEAIARQLRNG